MTRIGNTRIDLTNRRFGKLVALNPTDKRDKDGNVYWNCICDCVNQKDVTARSLIKGNTKSCGCIAKNNFDKQHDKIKEEIKRLGGTTVQSQNSKTPKTSKTGVKGVSEYYRRGKFAGYRATLICRGKQYYGGIYPTIAEAKAAREKLEEKYFINHESF